MKGRITTEKGKTVYEIDGVRVSKKKFYRLLACPDAGEPGDSPGGASASGWPMKSEAMAVGVHQIDQAEARNKRHGINVTYDRRTGEAIIPDRAERKKLIKFHGFFDKDGGYGD